MSLMFRYNIPLIGTKGVYSLTAPFNSDSGEILECIAVRKLSAYIANNDDAYAEVYQAAGLTQDDYDADLNVDAEIVTLINDKGKRYLVPGQYIASYPVQDGVLYRPITITVALPPMLMDQDMQPVMDEIRELILTRLGVDSSTALVEMAEPRAIDRTRSENVQTARAIAATNSGTSFDRINRLQNIVTDLVVRNQALETYILANP